MDIEYSDSQKHYNYLRIGEVIRHFQTGGRITEDWMEEHRAVILLIRDFFGNIEIINMECQDKTFRSFARESEMLLNHLVEEIRETKTFTPDIYYRLNLNFKKMFEIVLKDDELCQLMSSGWMI